MAGGLIHVDAHTDTNDEMFGEKIAHGTTFRRAVEEGLLDLKRVVQIGQRAQGYAAGDFQWGVDQAFAWCRRSSAGISRWRR